MGADEISDFVSGEDQIRVSAAGFGAGLTAGMTLSSPEFVLGSTATLPTHRFIYDVGTGQLFFDANGSNAGGSSLLATLAGAPSLSNSDIFVTT
ncbi:MAG: hypothetical protein AAGG02_05455 [Cyanobacteria bacterium P01_H01_bin.15]